MLKLISLFILILSLQNLKAHTDIQDCPLNLSVHKDRIQALLDLNRSRFSNNLYENIIFLLNHTPFLPTDPLKVLVLGPGMHFDEWLPFLLAKPDSKIHIIEPVFSLVHMRSIHLIFAEEIIKILQLEEGSTYYGKKSQPLSSILKKVLNSEIINEIKIAEFLQSRVLINSKTFDGEQYDLVISRMALHHEVDFTKVKKGGVYWIVDQAVFQTNELERAESIFGKENVFSIEPTRLNLLHDGRSYFTNLFESRFSKVFIVFVP